MSNIVTTLNSASRFLNYFLAVPMITFGMIGALLTVVIFIKHRVFWHTPTITYLLAGAMMTAVHLPTIYLGIILAGGFKIYIFMKNDALCRLYYYFLYVTTASAISFPCWAAFDQYASTNRKASFRHRWSSMRFVRHAIIGTILFWLIFYLPVLILTKLESYGCTIIIPAFRKMNNYVLTPLIFTIIPVILVSILMGGILRNLRAMILVNQHNRLERQIRRMLIPQVVLLAISGFPFGLESFYLEYTANVDKSELRRACETLILQILRLFYHVNFVCTFYIYLCMSHEVRQPIRQIINRCFRTNRVQPVRQTTATNPILLRTFNSNHPS